MPPIAEFDINLDATIRVVPPETNIAPPFPYPALLDWNVQMLIDNIELFAHIAAPLCAELLTNDMPSRIALPPTRVIAP